MSLNVNMIVNMLKWMGEEFSTNQLIDSIIMIKYRFGSNTIHHN